MHAATTDASMPTFWASKRETKHIALHLLKLELGAEIGLQLGEVFVRMWEGWWQVVVQDCGRSHNYRF